MSLFRLPLLALVLAGGGLPALATEAPQAATTAIAAGIDPSLYRLAVKPLALPAAWAPLRQAVDAWTAAQEHNVLDSLRHPDPEVAASARRNPWSLDLEYRLVAQTDTFAIVQANGSAWTGGAHPNPLLASFAYDLRAGRVIALDDLFSDFRAAEAALARLARRQLLARLGKGEDQEPLASDPQMVRDGTATGKDNYRNFSLLTGADRKAHGLKLIFPTYQVAAYVAGPQSVDVPSKVFARWLKPAYRDAFR
jgi:hypothetical protein